MGRKESFTSVILLLTSLSAATKSYGQTPDTTSKHLEEVTVSVKIPIKISGDSVSYLIDSFRTKQNASAEEVIKKLPGIELVDGKIMVQGKEVKKVFINGKGYTGSDITTLTKNLPAETLEKVEFSDWIDERSQFTGVVSSRDEKAMNLKLKKQYSEGLTGRSVVGYGSKERYQGNLFSNFFSSSLRVTVNGDINNTGASIPFSGAFSAPQQPGLNNSRNLVVSFSLDPSTHHSLTGSLETGASASQLTYKFLRTTFLPGDSTLYGTRLSETARENTLYKASINSKYKFDSTAQLRTEFRFNLSDTRSASLNHDANYGSPRRDEFLFRRDRYTTETSLSRELNLSTSFQKRGQKKGRTFSSFFNFKGRESSSTGTTKTANEYAGDIAPGEQRFNSTRDGRTVYASLQVEYTEPLNKNSMLIGNVTSSLDKGNTEQHITTLEDGFEYTDTLQTGNYKTCSKQHTAGISYQYRNERLSVRTGLEATSFFASTQPRQGEEIVQNGWNYTSSVNGRYNVSNKRWVDMTYNATMQPPSINQLQPVPDYTDSLNVYIGNPSLRPEIRHSINLSYSSNDQKKRRTWVRVRYGITQYQIINKTDLTVSQRITTYVNSSGGYNLGVSGGQSFPLWGKHLMCTPSLSLDTRKNISYNNNQYTVLNNYSLRPGVRVQYTAEKWYEGSINWNWSYNQTGSVTGSARIVQTHNISHEGTITVLKGLLLSYSGNYAVNSGYNEQINSNFVVLNFALEKTFEKWKALSLSLKGIDVLTQTPNIQQLIADNYIEEKHYNRLGSYFLLSVAYRFNYFPGKK